MAKILLAEDDDSLRRFLAGSLEKGGHEVSTASDGAEALTLLHVMPYDLLLTDIVMPGIDGLELAQMAAKLAPDIKIMFITGFAAVASHHLPSAPPGARILSKPFHLRDLAGEVEAMLAEAC